MFFDYINSPFPCFQFLSEPPSCPPNFLSSFLFYFVYNPPSPTSAAHACMGIRPSTKAQARKRHISEEN